MEVLTIGIAGGTGSGKSTLANQLVARFGDAITVINHDSYYRRQDEPDYDKRALVNYDHPDAYENELLAAHMKELREGRSVQCPVYDFTIHNRSNDVTLLKPSRVLVVEGILILAIDELREQMDLKIFVDAEPDVRLIRRIVRDMRERERSLDSVVGQYLGTVKPMHDAFVEPSKKYADMIVPGGKNHAVLDLICDRIRGCLEG